jgi:hypothetical protein
MNTTASPIISAVLLLCAANSNLLAEPAAPRPVRIARASSGGPGFEAERAIDGRFDTRWSSDFSDPQWLEIDMGRDVHLVGLRLFWEVAYASAYSVHTSLDGKQWKRVYETTRGDGGEDDIDFEGTNARHVRIEGHRRGTAWGYSLFEVIPKTAEHPWGEDNPSGFFLKTKWSFQHGDAEKNGSEYIASHESWERQGYPNSGTGMYRTTFFVPSEWTNARPFVLLTDVRDEFELRINGRGIAKDHGHRRVLQYDVSELLHYHRQNEVVIEVTGTNSTSGILGSMILARDEKSYETGMRKLQKSDSRKFYQWLAHIEPEGSFPFWLTGRQGFWTTAGVDGDFKESLFCQDGTIEPYKCFSISPFLFADGTLVTREDAQVEQLLEKGFLPVPSVVWTTHNLILTITAFGAGPVGSTTTYVLYNIRNRSTNDVSGSLFLAARPFEVNPPWQWGGFTRMDHVRREGNRIRINEFSLVPVSAPDGFGATGAPEGDILKYLKAGQLPRNAEFHDPGGTATAALKYDFNLQATGAVTRILAIPLHTGSEVAGSDEEVEALLQDALRRWEARMPSMRIRVPDRHINDTLLAGIGHILINRDGPAIQPGSRAYEAAWMRDGALTSSALLKMGYTNEVREFLEWYGRYQYEDGRIPAIVIISRNEVNPVLELDSQGQWVSALLEYFRFTGDRAFLESQWESIVKALNYLANARAQEAEALKNNTHDPQRYAGLLPKSVSHEGYYPEPGNHSYWDNFWAVKGWADGAVIAKLLGHEEQEAEFRAEEQSLRDALYKSIAVAMEWHNINYIPGCAELGDFDPSSTAIAIVACDELDHLPQPALGNTFDRYYEGLLRRKEPGWRGSFSPYEIRIAQAFQMMGDPARGKEVLDYLMGTQRPSGWRQWPEAVYFPEDHGGYIGDMPHTWVASGLISAIRAMFLIEQPSDSSLELAAGIIEEWQRNGAGVMEAPTWWGPVSILVKRMGNNVHVGVRGDCSPPGGFRVRLPGTTPIKSVSLNREPYASADGFTVEFESLPATLVIEY